MRIMALDVGDRKIGVAMSDPLKITSQGLETYRRKNIKEDIDHFVSLVKEYEVECIISGLPKNMNGSLGPQAEKTKKFMEKIQEVIDIEVKYVDERLSSMEAERVLISGDVSRKNRKKVIDKLAANIILQSYLQRLN